MKTTIITNENGTGEEEWYAQVYSCLNCKNNNIWFGFKYCPDCGCKLVFKGVSE